MAVDIIGWNILVFILYVAYVTLLIIMYRHLLKVLWEMRRISRHIEQEFSQGQVIWEQEVVDIMEKMEERGVFEKGDDGDE
jgi:hypothetical protein